MEEVCLFYKKGVAHPLIRVSYGSTALVRLC